MKTFKMKKRHLTVGSIILVFLYISFFFHHEFMEAGEVSSIKVLLLMDDFYGANCPPIIKRFHDFGWKLTVAGAKKELTACDYTRQNLPEALHMKTDLLLEEIGDITVYDAVVVMPGQRQDNFIENPVFMELIRKAASGGVVVCAWCRGVRLLAKAGIIKGLTVTGNADYKAEYEAAGAIFKERTPPIIQGNIVTGVRSFFYQEQICLALKQAIQDIRKK